jgi:hypothetical protein
LKLGGPFHPEKEPEACQLKTSTFKTELYGQIGSGLRFWSFCGW